jgi:NitT/TauT family transport system permease protein
LYLAVSAAAAVGVWQLASTAGVGSGLLPAPVPVARELWNDITSGVLVTQATASLRRITIGFVLGVAVAIPTGLVMGWYRWAARLFEPWVQFLRAIPPLALIPLVIVLLGIGEWPKIFLIFLAAYLGTVIAVFEGVCNLDRTLVSAARVLGVGQTAIFVRVVIPATLPYLFVGLRVGLSNAWATVVAAELIAANSGLGHMMQTASTYFQITTVMVGVITIGFLALVMDRSIVYLGRYLTRWQER